MPAGTCDHIMNLSAKTREMNESRAQVTGKARFLAIGLYTRLSHLNMAYSFF